MEEIIVEIDDEGTVEVKTKGFKGKKCLAASKWLEEQLGTSGEIKKTSEYYAEETKEYVKVNRGSNGN
jgi:hypothetical protein